MIISLANTQSTKKLSEGDLIALTKNDKFIGYGQIITLLSDRVLLKLDNRASKTFNEIYFEDLPYDFQIEL